MNELIQFEIFNCKEMEYLVDTSNDLGKVGNLFSKLDYLNIKKMKHLRALWHCPELKNIARSEYAVGHSVQSKIFQNLQIVMIDNCEELNHVFSSSTIGDLSQLKKLSIHNCNMLKQIIRDDVDEKEERDEIIEEDNHQHLESNHFKTTSIPSLTTVNRNKGLKNSSILVSEFIWMIDRLKESDGVSTSNNELPSSRVKTSQPIQVNSAEMIIIIISLN
ncbi:hypothetical protein ACSQ67_017810 [Phaseolus vulgaris]